MQFFIDKMRFGVLQPYHAVLEYQGGQGYTSKPMGKLLRTCKHPATTYLWLFRESAKSDFWTFLP